VNKDFTLIIISNVLITVETETTSMVKIDVSIAQKDVSFVNRQKTVCCVILVIRIQRVSVWSVNKRIVIIAMLVCVLIVC
jgi:hypothetical protein